MTSTVDPWFVSAAVIAIAIAIVAALRVWKEFAGNAVIVTEGQRGVVYKFGVYTREVGPGRHWAFPGTQIKIVNTNDLVLSVSGQEVMSQDRLAVKLTAVATYGVRDVRKALETSAEGHYSQVYRALQLALRDLAAELPLEELVDQRTKLDDRLTQKAHQGFEAQGCELLVANLRDVILPAEIRRLATEAVRAKMEATASLERARGEQASLRALNNAARLLKGNPELMNLRVLQALSAGPGKAAPTIILSGGSGIVPVSTGPEEAPPEPTQE